MNEVWLPLGRWIAGVYLACAFFFSELSSKDGFSIVSLSNSSLYCCVCTVCVGNVE